MQYLNLDLLNALDETCFRAHQPYPWFNPANLLTEAGYQALYDSQPTPELFECRLVQGRRRGRENHPHYSLSYHEHLPVGPHWHAFIAELEDTVYTHFLQRMLGMQRFSLSFHWHYMPSGCSISPHCDTRRKLGSHVFYWNTERDWEPHWGGETLILDDYGAFPSSSAPAFEDFARTEVVDTLGNRSLLSMRGDTSWHGVREIQCPPHALRKVFIVVIDSVQFT